MSRGVRYKLAARQRQIWPVKLHANKGKRKKNPFRVSPGVKHFKHFTSGHQSKADAIPTTPSEVPSHLAPQSPVTGKPPRTLYEERRMKREAAASGKVGRAQAEAVMKALRTDRAGKSKERAQRL